MFIYIKFLDKSSILEIKMILKRLVRLCGISEDEMTLFVENKINKSADNRQIQLEFKNAYRHMTVREITC